jgi:hypothetical protein
LREHPGREFFHVDVQPSLIGLYDDALHEALDKLLALLKAGGDTSA